MMASSVLIVEDERIVAMDLQETLCAMGYDAYAIASSAADAMRRAAERCPDVVLMDIRIKGDLDGIETATLLRELYDVPVIYLTAYADEATIERAKKSQPYGYLLKPVNASDLRSAIEVCTHRHDLEKQLRERENWFSTTLQAITDAVVAVDGDGTVNFMNRAAEALIGVPAITAVGHPLWDQVRDEWGMFASDGTTPIPRDQTPLMRALAGEVISQAEVFMRLPGGGRWHSVNATPVRDPDGTVRGAVAVSRDITDLRRALEDVTHAAVRDELSGLLNRRGFQERAEQALHLAQRSSKPLALVYIDLNGMKAINDQLGHAAGDRALVETAALLRETFRVSDLLARLGGDEFVVLASDYTEDDDGQAVRSRFMRNLDALNRHAERPFRLSVSLGVTIYDAAKGLRTIDDLLAESDRRMYVAKELRRFEGTQPIPKLR